MALKDEIQSMKTIEQGVANNKVVNFAYTNKAYTDNDVNGVDVYDFNKDNNIPTNDPDVIKVNPTVITKGYRAQASSITRMLVNHIFGRVSYNLNKTTDLFTSLLDKLGNAIGEPNGIATLDADGRIPYSQLPETAVEYKGEWNAETNTPTLEDGIGTKGDMYYVSTDGTQNLGSGDIVFLAGDRIIYNGSVWQKLSGGSVKKVNNIRPDDTGNVQLTGENIQVSTTDDTLLSKFKLRDIFSHLLGRFWTQSNITSASFNFTTYANGIWVAGSSNNNTGLYYSQDGITWTQSNITSDSFKFATYANGIWVAGSNNNNNTGLYYSQDGITWTQSNITSGRFYFATYANGIWVARGYSKGLYYSQDGITWTQSNITSGTFYFTTYANGIWVAGSKGLYYSQDGITWTQSNITSDYFNFATYANGIWVAGTGSKGLYYSQDGITWTQSNITSGRFYFATYANGICVAGGDDTGLYYSQDGITWTQSNITSDSFKFATYANGIWVAGSKGLYYSQDGITWTQSNITSASFNFTTYANGIWVVGSEYSDGLYYSQDGITWTQSNITSGTFYFTTYANGIWVAGGYGLCYSDINTLIRNGWLVLSE